MFPIQNGDLELWAKQVAGVSHETLYACCCALSFMEVLVCKSGFILSSK